MRDQKKYCSRVINLRLIKQKQYFPKTIARIKRVKFFLVICLRYRLLQLISPQIYLEYKSIITIIVKVYRLCTSFCVNTKGGLIQGKQDPKTFVCLNVLIVFNRIWDFHSERQAHCGFLLGLDQIYPLLLHSYSLPTI